MRLFLSIVILTFFVSCSKSKKINKRLSGTWNVVTLKVTDFSSNLSHYADATGTLQFSEDGKKSTSGSYDFSIDYSLNGTLYQLHETGTYSLNDDACTLTSTENDETPARVVYINKEDLEFGLEKPNTNRLLMVLKKND